MRRFNSVNPGSNDPIRIEHVFAEKPNGGIVTEPGFDAPATTAVYADGDKFKVIKCIEVVADYTSGATTIKVRQKSGAIRGNIFAYGGKAAALGSSVNGGTLPDGTDLEEFEFSLAVNIPKGAKLYEAKAAGDNAQPKGEPVYVTGNDLVKGAGDQPVRLINGANLRKETANIGDELAAMMSTINLV